MKKIELVIEGMHCQGCVKRVENALGALDGVNDVKVELEDKIATVEYDTQKVSLEEIKEAIEDIGFSVEE